MAGATFVLGLLAGAILGPVVLIAGLLWYARRRLKQRECAPPWVPRGEPVSLAWEVQPPGGRAVNLDALCGGRVVFLNFWATWCGPCVQELPGIEKLYRQFKDRVAFVCVSKEDPRRIAGFMTTKGYTLPVYHLPGEAPEEYRAEGIPATFIISRERRMVLRHVGAADWGHEKVIRLLERSADRRGSAGPFWSDWRGEFTDAARLAGASCPRKGGTDSSTTRPRTRPHKGRGFGDQSPK